jgi:hypothetical protein
VLAAENRDKLWALGVVAGVDFFVVCGLSVEGFVRFDG